MRIKTHPLTGRIQPLIMLAAEGATGGGGGAATATPPPPGMGGAFSQMAASLKAAAAPAGGETPPPAEEPPPAPTTPPKPTEPAVKPKPAAPAKGAANLIPEDAFKEPAAPAATTTPPAAATTTPPAELNTAELTKGMSEGGRKNFERLENHYKGKLTQVETELADLKRNPVTPAEIEEAKTLKADYEKLKREHAEMLKTVEVIGLERSPQFQQKYVAGRQKLVEEAARRVLNAGGSSDKFKAALLLDGRAKYDAIEEALNDAPGFIANQVAAVVTQIETLDEERAKALEDASGKLTEWTEEETMRQRQDGEKLAKAREARFSELLPELSKSVIFLRQLPDDAPGAPEWNALVRDVADKGKQFLFNASNFDDFAGAAVKAQAYDKMQEFFLKVREENISLQRQVAELTGAEPGGAASGGAGGGGGAAGGKGEEKPLTFAQRVKMGMDAGGAGS